MSLFRFRNFKESNLAIICRTAENSESSGKGGSEAGAAQLPRVSSGRVVTRLETLRSGNHTKSVGGRTKRSAAPITNLNTPKAVEHFRKVVAEWAKEAMRSKASARKAMIDSGIWDESGKLTKTYRS